MIDIHMHIIPNVDDGSSSMETSMEMIRRAKEQGVTTIIATPHDYAFYLRREITQQNYTQLKNKSPVKMYIGSEIYCESDIMTEIIYDLETKVVPSINKTEYVLIEFSTDETFDNALYCIRKLQQAKWKPIIAHVERYNYTIDQVRKLKEIECLLQINLFSLKNEQNNTIKHTAREIIKNELADFVGSDAHDKTHRNVEVIDGLHYLQKNCTKEYLYNITKGNAKKYLEVL